MNQLRQQNQRLLEQNQTLKQSLEQLIGVNTELTETIEQFSGNNNLAERISELENQNKSLKNQLHNTIRKAEALQNQHKYEAAKENEELSEIIKNLVEKSQQDNAMYQQEIARLTYELESQKAHGENQLRRIEQKHADKIREYEDTINELRKRNEAISHSIEQKVLKQSQQMQNEERKSLKVSATIEDLRNVLSAQIQEKDKVIRIYENLIEKLKQKIKQKY